jgi:hypothetical protein
VVLNRNKGGIVYRRHERRESYVSAGEVGTAECGLCEHSQTAHLTVVTVDSGAHRSAPAISWMDK